VPPVAVPPVFAPDDPPALPDFESLLQWDRARLMVTKPTRIGARVFMNSAI
jgi:hypothetical protein